MFLSETPLANLPRSLYSVLWKPSLAQALNSSRPVEKLVNWRCPLAINASAVTKCTVGKKVVFWFV